jgi:hypothetical protein
MLHFRDLQKDTNIEVKSREEIIIPIQYHYYEYFVPKDFDKIDNIQIGINTKSQLFIEDEYSCDVDDNLELIICATHSQFIIKIYFENEKIYIKYDSYQFSNEFKSELMKNPFQTDTHMYIDNTVDII